MTRFADPIVAAASWPNAWQNSQLQAAVALPEARLVASPTPGPAAIPLLKNGVLIDGTGAEPVPNAVVVIHAGHVEEAIGQADRIAIPAEAQVIDVQGATILPASQRTRPRGLRRRPPGGRAQAGVTTVRDLSSFWLSPGLADGVCLPRCR